MARRHLVLAGLVSVVGLLALTAGPALAGGQVSVPTTFNPDPVPAGTSTTASGTCPSQASSVTVEFSLTLADNTQASISAEFATSPSGAFSGTIDIPANAIVQSVETGGFCFDGELSVAFLTGGLSVSEPIPPTTTTIVTTTIATTTTAAPTTTTPSTTLGPVTLPNTGGGSESGPTALIGAGALAVGLGLILVARRRSADA